MYSITSDLDLISTTQLRTQIPKVTKKLKTKNVIVTSRNKPVGVFIDYDKFKFYQEMEEEYTDYSILKIAEARDTKNAKTVSHKTVMKKFGL